LITPLKAADPQREFPWDMARQTIRDLKILGHDRAILRVAFGIMFFWTLAMLANMNVDQFAFEGNVTRQTQVTALLGSLIVGVGIGSQFARIALPVSLVLTYLLIAAGASVAVSGAMGVPYAAGLTAALMVALLFILIVMLGRKINDLERALRDISLADELTGLHNRRGFYLLGELARRDARRARKALTVLFFDADGLKKINDTLGHDTGSEFLRDIALLLRTTFRGSDVVGRLGGDEFGVVVRESAAELVQAQMRLRAAVAAANDAGAKAYRLSFSAGSATTEPDSNEAFAALVDRADAAMYEDKRQRRAAREDGFAPPIAIGKVAPPSLPSAAAPFSERSVQTPMSPVHA